MEGTDRTVQIQSPFAARGKGNLAVVCGSPQLVSCEKGIAVRTQFRGRKPLEQIDMNIVPAEKRDGERKGSGADMDIHIYSQQERAH